MLPAALQTIEMNLCDGFIGHRGSDATSTAQSRLQRLQLLPVAGLAIDARQQQQAARVLFFGRFELFQRRERGLQLLVLQMHFGLHDQHRRAAIARNFQRAGQPFVATLANRPANPRRAPLSGNERQDFRFTQHDASGSSRPLPNYLPTAPTTLAPCCGERAHVAGLLAPPSTNYAL